MLPDVDFNVISYEEGRALVKQANFEKEAVPEWLKNIGTGAQDLGHRAWSNIQQAAGGARDWAQGVPAQLQQLYNEHPELFLIGAGAVGGGTLGVGSNLLQPRRQRNLLGRGLTGALIGGGLGGAASIARRMSINDAIEDVEDDLSKKQDELAVAETKSQALTDKSTNPTDPVPGKSTAPGGAPRQTTGVPTFNDQLTGGPISAVQGAAQIVHDKAREGTWSDKGDWAQRLTLGAMPFALDKAVVQKLPPALGGKRDPFTQREYPSRGVSAEVKAQEPNLKALVGNIRDAIPDDAQRRKVLKDTGRTWFGRNLTTAKRPKSNWSAGKERKELTRIANKYGVNENAYNAVLDQLHKPIMVEAAKAEKLVNKRMAAHTAAVKKRQLLLDMANRIAQNQQQLGDYQPTPEQLAKAQDRITAAQKKLSDAQTRHGAASQAKADAEKARTLAPKKQGLKWQGAKDGPTAWLPGRAKTEGRRTQAGRRVAGTAKGLASLLGFLSPEIGDAVMRSAGNEPTNSMKDMVGDLNKQIHGLRDQTDTLSQKRDAVAGATSTEPDPNAPMERNPLSGWLDYFAEMLKEKPDTQ